MFTESNGHIGSIGLISVRSRSSGGERPGRFLWFAGSDVSFDDKATIPVIDSMKKAMSKGWIMAKLRNKIIKNQYIRIGLLGST